MCVTNHSKGPRLEPTCKGAGYQDSLHCYSQVTYIRSQAVAGRLRWDFLTTKSQHQLRWPLGRSRCFQKSRVVGLPSTSHVCLKKFPLLADRWERCLCGR